MDRRALTWLPIALLLLAAAGVGAWLALNSPRPRVNAACAGNDATAARKSCGIDTWERNDGPYKVVGNDAEAEAGMYPGSTFSGANDPAAKNPGDTRNPQPGGLPDSTPQPLGTPESPTKTGPSTGKPGGDDPGVASPAPEPKKLERPGSNPALKAALEPEAWEQHWARRGVRTPEYLATPVSGKIMSRTDSKGVAGATVGLITYFAESEGPLPLLLPVIHEFTTDKHGVFSGTVNSPRRPPPENLRIALYVSKDGKPAILGLPLRSFNPAAPNAFGIFWVAQDRPVRFTCDARAFNGGRRVVFTGELDPRSWSPALREETLAAFPSSDAGDDGFARYECPCGSDSLHYASLLVQDAWTQTRLGTASYKREREKNTRSRDEENTREDDYETVAACNIVFDLPHRGPAGRVVDADGNGLAGAVLWLLNREEAAARADLGGWFVFSDLPPMDKCDLACAHPDYINEVALGKQRDDTSVLIQMTRLKPRLPLRVTDRLTGLPLTAFNLRVVGLDPRAKDASKAETFPPDLVEVNSPDGQYLLVWEVPLKEITVESLGYLPAKFPQAGALKAGPSGFIEVLLAPGRKLEVTPRAYTAAREADKWFTDPKGDDGAEGPGIRTNWADQWIEWEVDFGEPPPAGVAGGWFDLVLGCTNFGIIDNNYQFKVDVFVDEKISKGTLSIKANSTVEQTGRLPLGPLSGKHRIRLVWRNDAYIPEQLDANIRYSSIKFLETAGN